MRNLILLPLLILLAGLMPVRAGAAEVLPHVIGYVQVLRGQVYALNDNFKVLRYTERREARVLEEQGPIYENDTILTGVNGKCQIMFEDGMFLVVGPDSVMKLAEFDWDFDNAEECGFNLDLGPGIFRYLSGGIVDKNPSGTSVDTPTSIIGIRGTEVLSLVDVGKGPASGIVAALSALGTPDDWGGSSLEFKNRVNELVRSLDIGQLFPARSNFEAHAHVSGHVTTPLFVTHRFNGSTVDVPLGSEYQATPDGPGHVLPVTERTWDLGGLVPKLDSAPLPPEYQFMLGQPGSNQGIQNPHGSTNPVGSDTHSRQ